MKRIALSIVLLMIISIEGTEPRLFINIKNKQTLPSLKPNLTKRAQVGEIVTFDMPVSGSIGYSWDIKEVIPKNIVQESKAAEITHKPGLIGAPATKTFSYKAIKPGTAFITLIKNYRGKEAEKFIVKVTVSAGKKRPTK